MEHSPKKNIPPTFKKSPPYKNYSEMEKEMEMEVKRNNSYYTSPSESREPKKPPTIVE